MNRTASLAVLLLTGHSFALAQGWPGHGRDPQHSNIGLGPSQTPGVVRWSTPVDLQPQFSGDDLLIHYGSPVITRVNTVLVPVKVGAADGFRVEARRGSTGAVIWSWDSDYTQPAHNWAMPFGIALAPKDRVVAMPAGGGTIATRTFPDAATGTGRSRDWRSTGLRTITQIRPRSMRRSESTRL